MRIAEFFESIQGEGRFAGIPSVFVRTTGCNLRCRFCDTPYSSWKPEGAHELWQDLLRRVVQRNRTHVVITGGEPLLQPDVVPLTRALAEAGKFVTIETAGTLFRPVHADLMSVSPKRANSTPESGYWSARHEHLRDNRAVVDRMLSSYTCQLKYVIETPEDVVDVDAHVAQLTRVAPETVWLMPQGVTEQELREKMTWLPAEAQRRGYQVSERLQIELYGNQRGT